MATVGQKTYELAKQRHNVTVMAAAAAVLAVPRYYQDPEMIHYGAAAIVASGVVGLVVEGVKWVWEQLG